MQQADTSLRYNQHCYTVDVDLRKSQINYMLGIDLGSLDQVKSFITDFINPVLILWEHPRLLDPLKYSLSDWTVVGFSIV